MHLNRTAALAVLTLLLAVAAMQQVTASSNRDEPAIAAPARTVAAEPDRPQAQVAPQISPPEVTYGDRVDTATIDAVEWAVGRYVRAGLQLPDLHITVPATCQGRAGAYVVGEGEIRLCSSGRKLVLHEMAHAWVDVTYLEQEDYEAMLAERDSGDD